MSTQHVKLEKLLSYSSVSDTLMIILAKEKRTKINQVIESEGFFFLLFVFSLKKLHFLPSLICFGTQCTDTLTTFKSRS